MISQSPGSPNWDNFGSPETKSHSDVSATKRRREYYMGEGGGFPRVQAMVNLVSPESPMACLSIKSVLKNELTKLLVGLMQVRVNKQSLSLFLIPSQSFNTPYPFSGKNWECVPSSSQFHCLSNLDPLWV
jgi:hypothetical protein